MKLPVNDSLYQFSPMKVVLFRYLENRHFVAIIVAFPEKLEQGSDQNPVPSHWTTTLVYRTGCALLNIEVTVSSITKCLNTSTICRKVARCDKKLCVVLIEADIFNKAVQEIYPSL